MPQKKSHPAGMPSWVDVTSPDVKKTAAFYGKVFGWEAVEAPEPEAGGYTMFKLNGKNVAAASPQWQENVPPSWTTYVTVDDADKTTELVLSNGGTVLVEPMDVFKAGRMAVYASPAGAVLAVWQPGEHIGAEIVDEPNTYTWTELMARNPQQALEYYPAVFGWTTHTSEMGDQTYTEFKLGEESIAGMMPMPAQVPAQVPSYWMPYFAVSDPDATAATIEQNGGTIQVPPTDIPPGRFAVVRDPFGATFGIIKLNPRS